MRKWASVLAVAGICIGCGEGQTENPETAAADGSAKLETPVAEVVLLEGTTLRLRLRSAVASDTSRVEDPVRAELREAVVVDGATVLPTGTVFAISTADGTVCPS